MAEFISVSNVISKFRQQYHKTFSQGQTDENNAGYFIQFYIQSVQMAFKSLRDFALRISKEKVEKPAQKIPGYNERQTTVLQWLREDGEKMITIRELRSVYGVSKETARTDLTVLVEKGWIKYYNINKKTYAFVKGEGFDELATTIEAF
ncbi:DeoR family transcriptional regulator [Niabella hibiscisoli]|uniref:DeoR family transcriptional regulator n=1 Tax=Niabella hibiscisoli TaxID=1825928 RepID=UPI001F0F75A9|nr:DeoR family transcriptional regulator [Niabella hibiscisoli]MCH5716265.1 DeoR family transcriptional regulator [Niabella hibiscisoli]